MKSFADWTQDLAASTQAKALEEQRALIKDVTDDAADGLGYASAHYGYITCPHCGYDFVAADYANHILEKHGDL